MNNTTVQVLSSIQHCLRISSCKNIEKLCAQLAGLYGTLSPKDIPVSRETLKHFFAHGCLLAVALDKDENIVGMGMFIPIYETNDVTALIKNIAILESWRECGIDRKIMDALVEIALSYQVRHVDLMIAECFAQAEAQADAGRRCRNRHRLGHRANLQRDGVDGLTIPWMHLDARNHIGFESLVAHGQVVGPRL